MAQQTATLIEGTTGTTITRPIADRPFQTGVVFYAAWTDADGNAQGETFDSTHRSVKDQLADLGVPIEHALIQKL